MKHLLALTLALVSPLALAATANMRGLVDFVIDLVIIGVIFGILLWLVRRAPFIPAEGKTLIEYALYFIAAIFVINWLLGLSGHQFLNWR